MYALGLTLGRTPDCAGNATDIIWNDGGALVDKEGKVALNSPETVAAMKRIKGWWDDKLIPPDSPTWDDTGNNSAYQKKQAAFVHQSAVDLWLDDARTTRSCSNNSTMAAMPAGKSGSYSGSGLVVVVDLQDQQERRRRQGPDPLPDGSEAAAGGLRAGRRALVSRSTRTATRTSSGRPSRSSSSTRTCSRAGATRSWPATPEPKLMAALGEVGTRLIIADMVQDIIVKGTAPEESVKKAHDAMVEVFKARGANV